MYIYMYILYICIHRYIHLNITLLWMQRDVGGDVHVHGLGFLKPALPVCLPGPPQNPRKGALAHVPESPNHHS